jgi:hypothetical protein
MAKKKTTRKKKFAKKAPPKKNLALKKKAPTKKKLSRRKQTRRRPADEIANPISRRGNRELGPDSGGQSGDVQGLSGREVADSESVEELAEEGQDYEAGIVSAGRRSRRSYNPRSSRKRRSRRISRRAVNDSRI